MVLTPGNPFPMPCTLQLVARFPMPLSPVSSHFSPAVFIHPSRTTCRLRLLLGRRGLGLGGLLVVAPDHDHGQEGTDDGGTEQDEDHGYADGPDARGEDSV